jgi:hypothetical protein
MMASNNKTSRNENIIARTGKEDGETNDLCNFFFIIFIKIWEYEALPIAKEEAEIDDDERTVSKK